LIFLFEAQKSHFIQKAVSENMDFGGPPVKIISVSKLHNEDLL